MNEFLCNRKLFFTFIVMIVLGATDFALNLASASDVAVSQTDQQSELALSSARAALSPSHIASNAKNEIAGCGTDIDLRSGAVFTLLNLPRENQIAAYGRGSDGSLCKKGIFATGGASDDLGAVDSGQNEVITSGGYVFLINPGSFGGIFGDSTVSVLRIEPDRLVLTDVISSGGPAARSITRQGDWVYVVNGGVPGAIPENVQGYQFHPGTGTLTPSPRSNTATIDPNGDPAQIEFTPDGRQLVISQRRVNGLIVTGQEPRYVEVMNVGPDGIPTQVLRSDVGGDAPFGFRISADNVLYLTHGFVTDEVPSGISSHKINADGTLTALTSFTPDGAGETCWNYVSKSTRRPYMYGSAYADSAVGLSQINADGTLTLINSRFASSAASGENRLNIDVGGLDIDGTVDANGTEYLYVLNDPLTQPMILPLARITGYRINSEDGSLIRLGNGIARNIPNNGFGLWVL